MKIREMLKRLSKDDTETDIFNETQRFNTAGEKLTKTTKEADSQRERLEELIQQISGKHGQSTNH